MRVFGTVFILVAVYRSVFVSSYLGQLAWFDSLANSSLLIRVLAIYAEISFAGLIMFALLQLNEDVPVHARQKFNKSSGFLLTRTPYVLFLCICLAQFFATAATIMKIEVLFAIEETLWGIAFLSILPLTVMQLKRIYSYRDVQSKSELALFRISSAMMAVFCCGYTGYSLAYHLPIEYWPGALDQFQTDTPFPAIRTGWQAVKDALYVVNKTRDFETWGGIGFFIWYTGYFTVCSWMVLVLMNAPRRLIVKAA